MTTIEWVKDQAGNQGKSWNPIVGCTKVSSGCKNCYAEVMARRLKGMGRPEYQSVINGNGRWTGKVALVPDRLEEPLQRKKPTTYFVNSMSDLFHESVPFEFAERVYLHMKWAEWHTFQVLTKRPERMLKFMEWYSNRHCIDPQDSDLPYPNVWLGVSVESGKYIDRIDYLRQTPAAVRFVSFEPLLDDVAAAFEQGSGHEQIDWAIVGGESGPKARPMYPEYARKLREWALCWGIPFFFKQWGSSKVDVLEVRVWERAGRDFSQKKGGRLLDGREWSEMPERKEQVR